MRKDYKHIIVDAGRHKNETPKKRIPDSDMDAQKAPMRNFREWNGEQQDYLTPLYRCLVKNVGRPWDKVYSELCANADPRSILGFHLREHINRYVIPNKEVVKTEGGYRQRSRWPRHIDPLGLVKFSEYDLFVDDYGILRKPKPKETWSRFQRNAAEAKERAKYYCEIEKRYDWRNEVNHNRAYIFASCSWWYVEWNYDTATRFWKSPNETFMSKLMKTQGKVFVRPYNRYDFVLTSVEDIRFGQTGEGFMIIPTLKRQLSAKEIRDAGLKNPEANAA